MGMLRVILERRGRGFVFESEAADLSVGGGPGDDLRLDPRVAGPGHFRLLRRRSGVVVQPRRPVWVGDRPVDQVPVVLERREPIRLGDYVLSVEPLVPGTRGLAGLESPWGPIEREIADRELGIRRYETSTHELGVAEGDAKDWLDRVQTHFPGVADRESLGSACFAVALAPGRRGSELLAANASIDPSAEAVFTLAIRLGERLAHLHEAGFVHGGLWPERLWLSQDGDLVILPPGPRPDVREPLEEVWFPAHRRAGSAPTADADLWAAQRFLRTWVSDAPVAQTARDWTQMLRARAEASGLDPAAHHLAKWVHVLQARFPWERIP